eukprot:NODE_136_length_18060_cov_0.656645.p13 type:complete len:135 gc:universal NODE_136_length_18060_cov_0.656645:13704-14108(+)
MTMEISDQILLAARTGDIDNLRRNESYIKQCKNIIHYACGNGHSEIVEYLLELEIFDPNVMNNDKNTPLHWCALTNSLECAKILLRYGGDPRITNRHGKSSISIALTQGYNDLLEMLAERAMELEENEECEENK